MRFVLLAGIAASIAMAAIQVARYPPLLMLPGGRAFVIEPAVALLVYAALIAAADGPARQAMFGVIAAAVQTAHLLTENTVHLGGGRDAMVTLAFMLATFTVWGVAGYRAGRLVPGLLAGIWSAVATMSIVVAIGFAIEFYWIVPSPAEVVTWGEFQRSGWGDVRAFTIANTLDSAFSHLLIGPIVGAVVGVIGGAIARIRQAR